MNIELIPLEKMIYDGKEICFGAKKEEVITIKSKCSGVSCILKFCFLNIILTY